MDCHFGDDMYESFLHYQTRLIRALDHMANRYGFIDIDATRSPEMIFNELQRRIKTLQLISVNGDRTAPKGQN
jgi:dTMP kinase